MGRFFIGIIKISVLILLVCICMWLLCRVLNPQRARTPPRP